ncbi:MAG: hypothetical protein HY454_00875 [Parcubacteria group bacterium]|nr:hypothetical protein [Parcubacteria group bacterium]
MDGIEFFKSRKWSSGIAGLLIVVGFLFWLACLNHVSVNEIGIAYDSMSGRVWPQTQAGWYMTTPFVRVAYITTLPVRVTIPSEARVMVSKLVRFKIEGLEDYIRLQGFSYLLGSTFENILLGYAFSGNTYSFLEIMQEPTAEKIENLRPL